MKEKIPVGGLNNGRERTAGRICEPEDEGQKPPPERLGGKRPQGNPEPCGPEGFSVIRPSRPWSRRREERPAENTQIKAGDCPAWQKTQTLIFKKLIQPQLE